MTDAFWAAAFAAAVSLVTVILQYRGNRARTEVEARRDVKLARIAAKLGLADGEGPP